ncbi:multidrug ABC transporter ATP-binding protein [Dokdonia pacifica]|uniref:ABC-type multidrug transport system, ATPase component n=1 Tax=Dokdonia pacifica TaxID=1627892 RepID=A0A238YHP1_9FLAO|nr:ABC transporter ATP-binding protein [Dokdonia pacifica]GGG12204.1 multidrug ABC transporter ATP-binding protein [Dokdonia pacifica]SNR70715.1 ABC-type multidrug transport system, ATPase component [Dokdonia pacifica]
MELIINNLSKTYSNGVKALNGVSLEISKGMFGLLGPNGAGKSSLMRTIATLQEADQGTVTLGEIDVLKQKDTVRKMLGYLPQEFGVYPKVSAEVLLNHLAVLKGISHKNERKEIVQALLHKTNLYEHRKKNLGGYSGGMKQRFGIAQALLANPSLIIVDEPTAGLDPAERNRFYNLLSELGEQAVVILSTHIVDDVKELCTDMAIINSGQVLYKGNPKEAITQLEGKVYRKTIAKDELQGYKQEYRVIAERFLLGKPIIHILSDIHPQNGFESIPTDLEDVYFSHIFGNLSTLAN